MGWSIAFDEKWQRDICWGGPAYCDHPECAAEIDRGLGYVCADQEPRGGGGCGLYFCGSHLGYSQYPDSQDVDDPEPTLMNCCVRCRDGEDPFPPKPDHPMWVLFKRTDASWKEWRAENGHPEPTLEMIGQIKQYEEEAWVKA